MKNKPKRDTYSHMQMPVHPVREVRVYTEPNNRDCDEAKMLLELRAIPYREVSVENDHLLRGWLAWATGQHTLPQIFIDGAPAGGLIDLIALDATGELYERVRG